MLLAVILWALVTGRDVELDFSTRNYNDDGMTQDHKETVEFQRKDPEKTIELQRNYLKEAEQGDADAQFYLGLDYYNEGVILEAVEWLHKAAEQGHADAQIKLGEWYYTGRGIKQDYLKSGRWLRKAAEQGRAIAQTNLGMMYALGLGLPKRYTKAIKWFRLAAEQGEAGAYFHLGAMYAKGHGVTQQDFNEAFKWYRKSAEQGFARGQATLGWMYLAGQGVNRDYIQAYVWFDLAASQGDDIAREERDKVSERMTPGQIDEARSLAREWADRFDKE